jgi:hypothetical protein
VLLLLLIACNRWLVLIPALALYAATQLFSLSVPGFPEGHVWLFNPLPDSSCFVIGALCGYAAVSGVALLPRGRWPGVLTAAIAATAALINLSWLAHWYYPALPDLLGPRLWPLVIDKTNLSPLRLINFLALAVVAARLVPPDSAFLTARVSHALGLCGRHSSKSFCLGILLSVMAHIILTELHDGLLMQLAVGVVGIAAMLGTGLQGDGPSAAKPSGAAARLTSCSSLPCCVFGSATAQVCAAACTLIDTSGNHLEALTRGRRGQNFIQLGAILSSSQIRSDAWIAEPA